MQRQEDVILAISSSSPVVSLAISKGEERFFESASLKSDGFIFNVLNNAMSRLSISIKDINIFLLDIGPGSFTGLRVSMAYVKIWAWLNRVPIYGTSSLDIVAWQCLERGVFKTRHMAAILDAKKGNAYGALYTKDPFARIGPIQLVPFNDIEAQLNSQTEDGDVGFARDSQPDAESMIRMFIKARHMFVAHTAFDIKPLYIYPDNCTIGKK